MSGWEPYLFAAAVGTQVAGQISAGNAQARQASAQAALLQSQAEQQQRVAQAQEAALRHRQSRELSRMRALLAGRDIDIASGSALLAQEQAAADAEFEALLLRSAGAAQAFDLASRARMAAASGADARRAAFLNAGTTLLTAGRETSRNYDKWFSRTP